MDTIQMVTGDQYLSPGKMHWRWRLTNFVWLSLSGLSVESVDFVEHDSMFEMRFADAGTTLVCIVYFV